MVQILEISDVDLKITMIHMLKRLNAKFQNFSRQLETVIFFKSKENSRTRKYNM